MKDHFALARRLPVTVALLIFSFAAALHGADLNKELQNVVGKQSKDQIEKVKKLAARGANVNALFPPGNVADTPLSYAAAFDNVKLVEELLRLGADVNTGKSVGPRSALKFSNAHLEIAKLLLENGADPNLSTKTRKSEPIGNQIVFTDRKGVQSTTSFTTFWAELVTPLALASFHGSLNSARVLLLKNSDVNRADESGHTPLLLSLAGVSQNSWEKGLLPEAFMQQGTTPLMLAAWLDQPELVALLLKKGADPAARNVAGQSALDIASVQGFQRVIDALKTSSKTPQ